MKPVLGGCAGIVGNSVTQYIDKNTTSKPERQTVEDALYSYKISQKTLADEKKFVETINTLKNSPRASHALRELFKAPVGIFGSSKGIAHEANHYAMVAERLIMVKALHKADDKPTDYFYSPISNDKIKQDLITSYNNKLNAQQNLEQNIFSNALVRLARAQKLTTDPVVFDSKCESRLLMKKLIPSDFSPITPTNFQTILNVTSKELDADGCYKVSNLMVHQCLLVLQEKKDNNILYINVYQTFEVLSAVLGRIKEKEEEIAEKENKIVQKDALINFNNSHPTPNKRLIAQTEKLIAQQKELIAQKELLLAQNKGFIAKKKDFIEQKNRLIELCKNTSFSLTMGGMLLSKYSKTG